MYDIFHTPFEEVMVDTVVKIFQFRGKEFMIYTELVKTGKLKVRNAPEEDIVKVFFEGDEVEQQQVYMIVQYMFDRKVFPDKHYIVRNLISHYVCRMKGKYASFDEWLRSIYSHDKSCDPLEETFKMSMFCKNWW